MRRLATRCGRVPVCEPVYLLPMRMQLTNLTDCCCTPEYLNTQYSLHGPQMNTLCEVGSRTLHVRHQQFPVRSQARPAREGLLKPAVGSSVPRGERSTKRKLSLRFCEICGRYCWCGFVALQVIVLSCPAVTKCHCWQALALGWCLVQFVTVRVR